MKHAIPFLFLLLGACSSSDPDVASTSAAGAGGAAGDMSGLFGGRGGNGSVTLLEDGAVVSGDDGSVSQDGGTVSGNDAAVSQDGGVVSDAGLDSGADAGLVADPECEGLELPESDCRCAGFETRAYFFCPGPLDKAGAVASCFGVSGFDLIGNVDTVVSNPAKVEFIRGLSDEAVWMHGTGSTSTPPYTMHCYVLTAEGDIEKASAACSEFHGYVCEEKP